MFRNTKVKSIKYLLFPVLVWAFVSIGCGRRVASTAEPFNVSSFDISGTVDASQTATSEVPELPDSDITVWVDQIYTPTPDMPHVLPTLRSEADHYVVQRGDTLMSIAQRYQVNIQSIIEENNLINPDLLEVGQVLVIPEPKPTATGPGFKIIPDSGLVFSPTSIGFVVDDFIRTKHGFLENYTEEIEGENLNGSQIVLRVAQEYSVSPRLLLAILEYRSDWVTKSNPLESTLDYPIFAAESWRRGLYRQLAYTANNLNRGFYLWRADAIGYWILKDGEIVPINPVINAGTAGVQLFFAQLSERSEWEAAIGLGGLYNTYHELFGFPFASFVEPLVPLGLNQPDMQLPIEKGEVWSYTGGPHGGWGDGSAWAALDFAPPGEALGCVTSDSWVVAIADGTIIRTGNGMVIQDIDSNGAGSNDGVEQTGWVVLYMHVEKRDRVQPGTHMQAGERIGHPSCEGGQSSGTHVHIARRYNGEWIAADGEIPFILDGWISSGDGAEYDGFLTREGITIEAWEGNIPENRISR